MEIAIIGSGNMAHGIGTRMVAGKQTLTIYDRDGKKAAALAEKLGTGVHSDVLGNAIIGDIVIFALPYPAISEIIKEHSEAFNGKVVVDISNPVDFKTFTLIPPAGTSGAEEIAKHLPKGVVLVKAFNTTFAGTLVKGEVDGKKLDVFMASESKEAKEKLASVINACGLRALDAGALSVARLLEAMQLLHMSMQASLGNTWMTAIKILQ